ncbi:MAG: ArdC-like ssDNA-binding domain-containing protein [Defluviimonas sp.]
MEKDVYQNVTGKIVADLEQGELTWLKPWSAVSWLEEAKLPTREENRVQVFPSSLRVHRLEEAETILAAAVITGTRRQQQLDIVRHLMNAPRRSRRVIAVR